MIPRLLCTFLAWLALACPCAWAAPLFISGLSGSYVPGATIEFDVGLPPIVNLGAYNVDLALTSPSGVAGVDYFFDVVATVPSPSHYVFPSAVNYFDAANVDSPSQHRLTLSDFDFGGVDVVAGVNDLVAHVVIQTTTEFLGELSLSFDTDGLFLDTPELIPTSVEGFDTIKSDTTAAGASAILPVPEPSTLLMVLAGSLMFGMKWRYLLSVLNTR